MGWTDIRGTSTRDLVCDSCGRLPHPRRGRLTVAKLAAVFPIELLMHAIASRQDLPIIATVALLAIITTILVIWVVEPSALRLLRSWLHAPALRTHRRINEAAAVWRLRATFDDKPSALEKLAGQLAPLGAEIMSLKAHPHSRGIRNELVVSAPKHVQASDLVAAAIAAGTVGVLAWPTTALALVDNSTKALALAARVSESPGELPHATAELLDAHLVADHVRVTRHQAGGHGPHEVELRIPTPWTGLFVISRHEPFTPAESARASRLAEIAEIAAIRDRPGLSEAAFQPGTGPRLCHS